MVIMKQTHPIMLAALVLFLSPASCDKCDKAKPSRNNATTAEHYTVEQFFRTVKLSGASFSTDGKRLLYTSNDSGFYNVYAVDTDTGKSTELTHSREYASFSVGFFPRDNRVLFRRDRAGNENYHLFTILEGGEVVELTSGERTKEAFISMSRDGRSMFTMNNGRDFRAFDLVEWDLDTISSRTVFENDLENPCLIGPVSGKSRVAALVRVVDNTNTRMFILDLDSGGLKEVMAHQGDVRLSPQDFGPDGKTLYFTTDKESEFAYLSRLDLSTMESETVYAPPWDVVSARVSHRGTYLFAAVNWDGATRMRVTFAETGKELMVPVPKKGNITGMTMDRDEKMIAFYHETDRTPPSLYLYRLDTGRISRLVSAENPAIRARDLARSQPVRFRARDGLEIPGYLYRPPKAPPGGRAPALVYVHGGPGGQSRYGFHPPFLLLADRGYAVLAVNNRGSGGYGRSFYHADDLRHGREPLWDCVDARRWLAASEGIDGGRIGIMGRSYGGYMVLAALAFQPEEFELGVDMFGISNWVRTLESTPPYWKAIRRHLFQEIGDPEKNRDELLAISPLFQADRIVKPLMIIQGVNDVRVIKEESDDMVAAIRERGNEVEYLVFEDEGHGLSRTDNEIECWNRVLAFLDGHLGRSALESAAGGKLDHGYSTVPLTAQ